MGVFRALGETSRGGYARREMELRSEVRKALQDQLVRITGDARARMRWTVRGFCTAIYLRRRLKLAGWPDGLLFADLSLVTGLVRISALVDALRDGTLRFEAVTDEEHAAAARDALCAAPSRVNLGLAPQAPRDDVGGRHRRRGTAGTARGEECTRGVRKTPRMVSEEAEARAERALEPRELFMEGRRPMFAKDCPRALSVLN